jgi:hypothetical protein
MLRPDDPWFLDEAVDEPGELLKVLPEIRHNLMPTPREEGLGLRSLFEEPDALAHSWRRDQASRRARHGALRPRAA